MTFFFYKARILDAPLELKRALKLYIGFERVSILVDVGGGVGETLKQLLPKYPSMKGINFDLPQVIQKAPPHQGIEHIEGDMFESVPTGDAILMKFVCHSWADEDGIKFLRNCHKALLQHGKVVVFEYRIPEVPNPRYISKHTCTLDNVMERTQNEFENLCNSFGFSKFYVPCSGILR
ncbi:Isoliquiritigenin 2'-O-methyltransferase [Glycine max]|nr:Isoliquiritigenin 2'-O-methyltransferase [Glycine max]